MPKEVLLPETADDRSYRTALESIKRSVIGNASQVSAVADRLRGVSLFPPLDCSDEVVRSFLRENGPREGDDIRIQMLFRLRDHVIRLERQHDRLVTMGTRAKKQEATRLMNLVSNSERSYQASLKMLNEYIRFIMETDLKVHAEARQTLGMAANVAIREKDLEIREEESRRGKSRSGGLRGLLDSLNGLNDESV
jgi:hypothetical protein